MVARSAGTRLAEGAASGTMRDVTLPTPIAERVLDLVERIPAGRVMAYGDIAAWFADEAAHAAEGAEPADPVDPAEDADAVEGADAVDGDAAGRPRADGPRLGPRQVGRVMARYGGGVPWWRVLRADGTHAPGLEDEGLRRLRDEGTPMRAGGTRVDMAEARWDPASGERVRERQSEGQPERQPKRQSDPRSKR